MAIGHALKSFAWIVLKDLAEEVRGRRAWPAMLLLGLVLVLLLGVQTDLPETQKLQVVSGSLWLAIFFAGTLALECSFVAEREEGCWQTLLLYPVSPGVIFLAKVTINCVALLFLECVLIPVFAVASDTPFLRYPLSLAMVASLGNLGFAAVGVIVSALTAGLSHRGSLLALLLLPLATPVLLAAAEATRLLVLDDVGEQWWRWVQMLVAFIVLFTTLGLLVFEFAIED